MVKPAGTGNPIFVISARPAPLPPSRSRQVPSPSALPAPKNTPIFSLYASLSIIGVVERSLLASFHSGGRKNCRHADFYLIQVILEIVNAALHHRFQKNQRPS